MFQFIEGFGCGKKMHVDCFSWGMVNDNFRISHRKSMCLGTEGAILLNGLPPKLSSEVTLRVFIITGILMIELRSIMTDRWLSGYRVTFMIRRLLWLESRINEFMVGESIVYLFRLQNIFYAYSLLNQIKFVLLLTIAII